MHRRMPDPHRRSRNSSRKSPAAICAARRSTILDANILGLSCSRVCPVDVLVRRRLRDASLQSSSPSRSDACSATRWIGFTRIRRQLAVAPGQRQDVACIGAGPASLACAAELRRRGFAVTIFDRNPLAGGLNTYGIAEYKLRPADSLKEVELVRTMGVEFRLGAEAGRIESTRARIRRDFSGRRPGPDASPERSRRRSAGRHRRAAIHRRLQNRLIRRSATRGRDRRGQHGHRRRHRRASTGRRSKST